MPGALITEDQRRKFYQLHIAADGPRLPASRAAELCGFSRQTGWRLARLAREAMGAEATTKRKGLPDPKPWEELSTDARSALRDFNVFRELFFADEPQVWAYDASMRIVEALLDTSQRTFIDLNVFPGSGKTTVGLRLGCWLIAGGGILDPRRGRALRLMYGSEVMTTAKHMVKAVRNFLSLRRPFRDLDRDVVASHVLAVEYGRFRPLRGFDPDTQWSEAQFVVAQMAEVELYDKEPTVQAASYKSGFLGERVDLAWWDDLSTTKNSSTPKAAASVDEFVSKEAERRVEPGGVFALVGQRLGPLDIHAKRLAATRRDGSRLYVHITYPAHHDELCDGRHRQWDGSAEPGAGCLTDARRLPEPDWQAVAGDRDYRTVFQQEDVDPERVLVQHAWIVGGPDEEGFDAPGCYDPDRGFGEHPPREVGRLVNYAAVDPSVSNFWAMEWWAYQPESRFNYLIWGERRRMAAGALLDWDNAAQAFTGLMEEWQKASVVAGQAIRCWVIEANAAHRYLFQFEHYRRWRRRWPDVAVIAHQTGLNKLDEAFGVSGILPGRYRTGSKRLPNKQGLEGRNYLRHKVNELTHYPFSATDDTVMVDWMGEVNLPRIVAVARRAPGQPLGVDAKLPGYLQRTRHTVPLGVEGAA